MVRLSPGRQLQLLDFDVETRRVGFHNAGRFKPDGCEPVIIAAAWNDEPAEAWGLGTRWTTKSYRGMIERFRELYDEADILTGHYIRKFDLPILSGAMMECGLAPLQPKLVIDTKCDLIEVAALSMSQENLATMKELTASKFHMNDTWWRKVARLTPEGMELARTRVVDDVKQHQELRAALRGWLKAPEVWKP